LFYARISAFEKGSAVYIWTTSAYYGI